MYSVKIQVGRKNPACADPPHVIVAEANTAELYIQVRDRVALLLTGVKRDFVFLPGEQDGEKLVDTECGFHVTITQVRVMLRDEFKNIYVPYHLSVPSYLFRAGDAPYSFIRGSNVL